MEKQFVVGVDVGGQTSKIGIVDMRGQVLAQTVIRTDTYTDVEPYIDEVAAYLGPAAERSPRSRMPGMSSGANLPSAA